jgi:hypothetical protein
MSLLKYVIVVGQHPLSFVGDIPLHTDIRVSSDDGSPIVVSQPNSVQVYNN